MREEELYAPPAESRAARGNEGDEGDPRKRKRAFVKASRGARLGGVLVDVMAAVVLGQAGGSLLGSLVVWAATVMGAGATEQRQTEAIVTLGMFGVFFALEGWLVAVRGQSIGKMLMRTRIVRFDGRVVGAFRGVVLRSVPLTLALLLPSVGVWTEIGRSTAAELGRFSALLALLDAVWIFGPSKRCLHDVLAGTYVEQMPEPATQSADEPVAPRKQKKRKKKTVTVEAAERGVTGE